MSKFKKDCTDINNLIEFISSIRSSKSELKITPKLYCDIHFLEKSSKLNKIIQNNLILAKHVGRIGNVLKSSATDGEILLLSGGTVGHENQIMFLHESHWRKAIIEGADVQKQNDWIKNHRTR